MKIIISRKGFDSTAGGNPSPILENKKMISMPIPEANGNFCFNDILAYKNHKALFERLYKKINSGDKCHLDPDIDKDNLKNRPEGWKPLFGQIGSSQIHLENQGVGIGDLFLFFGWFQHVKDVKFVSPEMHVIFGYFQIGEIIKTKNGQWREWMEYHPHIVSKEYLKDKTNTVYVARKYLSFNRELLGAGIFDFDKNLVLTKDGHPKSQWRLPSFFESVKMSHHPNPYRIKSGEKYFQSTGRGQEFVVEENKNIEKWAINLINQYGN